MIYYIRYTLSHARCRRINSNCDFAGDILDDEELLDWLTDPTNMEMNDHIERVNRKMFEKIRQSSDYVAVFFCKYDDPI